MLGDFEFQILFSIRREGVNSFGVNIKRNVEETFARRVSFGALYTTLSRMEKKGFIEAEVKPGTSVRGGRRKKLYKITGLGTTQLVEKENTFRNLFIAGGESHA